MDYFRSGFIDRRVNRFLIPALFYGEARAGSYELRHLLIPLFGMATLPAVFAYASLARMPGLEYYARANVRPRIVTTPPEPPSLPDGTDYYIATKRFGFDRGHPAAPVVHTIGRAGAVFTVIKGRSAP